MHMKELDEPAPMASCVRLPPHGDLRPGLNIEGPGGRPGRRDFAVRYIAELDVTLHDGEKLTCTEAATRDARTRSRFPLRRNDLHGTFWLPLRSNVEKPTCTVAANTTQKELVGAGTWSAHVPCPWWTAPQASDEAGPPPPHPLTCSTSLMD